MSEPEVLLLDYGGVLTTSLRSWLEECCNAVGADTDLFLAAVAAQATSPFALIETGAITREELGDLLTPALVAAAHQGAAPTGAAWLDGIEISEKYLDSAMIATVERLHHSGVRVVLLSNSWGAADQYPWKLLPTFDEVVISGEVGVRKPDPGIYEIALSAAGVPADRCVFIDDSAENLPPAKALGIRTIHHVDPPKSVRLLDDLFTPKAVQSRDPRRV